MESPSAYINSTSQIRLHYLLLKDEISEIDEWWLLDQLKQSFPSKLVIGIHCWASEADELPDDIQLQADVSVT